MDVIVVVEKYKYESTLDGIYVFDSWSSFFNWAKKISNGANFTIRQEKEKMIFDCSAEDSGINSYFQFEVEVKKIIESVSL